MCKRTMSPAFTRGNCFFFFEFLTNLGKENFSFLHFSEFLLLFVIELLKQVEFDQKEKVFFFNFEEKENFIYKRDEKLCICIFCVQWKKRYIYIYSWRLVLDEWVFFSSPMSRWPLGHSPWFFFLQCFPFSFVFWGSIFFFSFGLAVNAMALV